MLQFQRLIVKTYLVINNIIIIISFNISLLVLYELISYHLRVITIITRTSNLILLFMYRVKREYGLEYPDELCSFYVMVSQQRIVLSLLIKI